MPIGRITKIAPMTLDDSIVQSIISSVSIDQSKYIDPSFFGIHYCKAIAGDTPQTPYQPLGFGTLRLWDTGTNWCSINPSNGTFNWTRLDAYVNFAQTNGMEILMTLGQAPSWANGLTAVGTSGTNSITINKSDLIYVGQKIILASDPTSYTVTTRVNSTSFTVSPNLTMNINGGVTDNTNGSGYSNIPPDSNHPEYWTNYVSAVATRYKGIITHYEIWNEANSYTFFTGTVSQLATLTQLAHDTLKTIDPNIQVISACCYGGSGVSYMDSYLALASQYVDIVGCHLYVSPLQPESMIDLAQQFRAVMYKHGIGNLPLWNTESTWLSYNNGSTFVTESSSGITPMPDAMQAAYALRMFISNWVAGLDRCYLYGMDYTASAIAPVNRTTPAQITPTGYAIQRFISWAVGKKLRDYKYDSTIGLYQVTATDSNGVSSSYIWTDDTKSVSLSLGTYAEIGSIVAWDGTTTYNTINNNLTVNLSPILINRFNSMLDYKNMNYTTNIVPLTNASPFDQYQSWVASGGILYTNPASSIVSSELNSDPNFASSSISNGGVWSANSPWVVIGNGRADVNNSSGVAALYNNTYPLAIVGTTYQITFTVANYVSGAVCFSNNGDPLGNQSGTYHYGAGTFTDTFVATRAGTICLQPGAPSNLSITYFSIKTVSVTAGSIIQNPLLNYNNGVLAAPKFSGDGSLLTNITNVAPLDLINTWGTSGLLFTPAPVVTIGPELLLDTNFTSTSFWGNVGGSPNWSISGGIASSNGGASSMYAINPRSVGGTTYQITLTISNITTSGGAVAVGIVGGSNNQYGPYWNTTGTHITTITCSAVNDGMQFAIQQGSSALCSVSYFSIKKVTTTNGSVTQDSTLTFNQATKTLSVKDFITSGPYIDVRAYGAVGDGVTDDTAALQAALNAAIGKTVLFQPLTYKITSKLTVSLSGSKLIGVKGATQITGAFNYYLMQLLEVKDSVIDGIFFNNTYVNATLDPGYAVLYSLQNNIDGLDITNCKFSVPNAFTSGFCAYTRTTSGDNGHVVKNLRIRHNEFVNIGCIAMTIMNRATSSDQYEAARDIAVTDNYAYNLGTLATSGNPFGFFISLDGYGSKTDVSRNTIRKAAGIGIENTGWINSSFNNNRFGDFTASQSCAPMSWTPNIYVTQPISNCQSIGNIVESLANNRCNFKNIQNCLFMGNLWQGDVTTASSALQVWGSNNRFIGESFVSNAYYAVTVGSGLNITTNNIFDCCTFSTSGSTIDIGTVNFSGAGSTGNIVKGSKITHGTGSVLLLSQDTSATNNKLLDNGFDQYYFSSIACNGGVDASTVHQTYQAGVTADQNSYISWLDHTGATQYRIGRISDGTFQILDSYSGSGAGLSRMLFSPSDARIFLPTNGTFTLRNSGNTILFKMSDNGNTVFNGYTTSLSGAAVSSAGTITPTGQFFHVTGTTQINTISVPFTGFIGSIRIIPDGVFTTGTSGNIALASTAVVGKVLEMTYDGSIQKWYPSY